MSRLNKPSHNDLIFTQETFKDLEGPGFGPISLASRRRMRRQKGSSDDGIDILDLIRNCKQIVMVVGLKREKLATSGQ